MEGQLKHAKMLDAARHIAETVNEAETTKASERLGFDEAFVLHHRVVFRTARSIVTDDGLAEDVTQEVFLRFYRFRDSVPEGELLRAWLLRVAMNVARNTIRGNSRTAARDDAFVAEAQRLEPYAATPEHDYERQTEIAATRATLERIKEPLRSCLLLKQQGLSYREIAATLELNETSIGQYVARGRKEFVRLYGKIGGRGDERVH